MDVIAVVGAACVVLSLMVLFWAVSGRRAEAPVDMSLHSSQRVVGTRDDLRARSLAPDVGERALAPMIERLGARLRHLQPTDRTASLARKIRTAGSPAGWTVERVLAAKLLGAVFVGGLLLVRFVASPSAFNLFLCIGGGLFGYFLPNGLLDSKVAARQQLVRREIASVVDQLAVMVSAGLSIDASIVRLAQTSEGPLADELSRVVQDMRVGVGRSVALTGMADRVDVPELRGFVAALAQADQLGVPVSDTLRVQAVEMRTKQRQAAEEEAMKLPVKILFPMVIFILPVLFIVLLGPVAIRIFDQFSG